MNRIKVFPLWLSSTVASVYFVVVVVVVGCGGGGGGGGGDVRCPLLNSFSLFDIGNRHFFCHTL